MRTRCKICDSTLLGLRSVYCSDKCKFSYKNRKEYLSKTKYKEARNVNAGRYNRTPRGKFTSYRSAAKGRGIDFHLSEEEFLELWRNDCSYCGSDIDTIGVDRIDNNIGYTVENITPCCFICNQMKSILSTKDFLNHIEKISRYNN